MKQDLEIALNAMELRLVKQHQPQLNSTEEPENVKQFILGLMSGKMKIKTSTWYWILLAAAFVLLSIVINWWVAFA